MKRYLLPCLAALALPAPAAEPLGRLFYTPEQRAQLDRLRRQPPAARPVVESTPAMPPASGAVTYSGMVRRSDGRYTAWINDRPVAERANDPALPRARVHADGTATVEMPHQGRLQLKVGQTADLDTGRVAESYTRPVPVAPPSAIPRATESAFRLRRRYDAGSELPPPDERHR